MVFIGPPLYHDPQKTDWQHIVSLAKMKQTILNLQKASSCRCNIAKMCVLQNVFVIFTLPFIDLTNFQ